jgi:hypothetical protein
VAAGAAPDDCFHEGRNLMRPEMRGLLLGCAVLGVSSVLFSPACSSSSSTSANQACSDLATARCQKMQECNPQGVINVYGDLSTCESRQTSTCVTNLSLPQTANTAAHTEACAQVLPNQACSDFGQGVLLPACEPPAGPRAAGGPCAVNAQCATAYCLILDTSACGVCAASPAVGDSCANNPCGPGLVCDTLTSKCAAPVGAGGVCDDSSSNSVCIPGTTCLGPSGSTTGNCEAVATTVGASCKLQDGGTRCSGRQGLYCNVPEGRVCAPVGVASVNQACGTIDGGVIDCTTGAFCHKASGSPSGTCVPAVSDSAACDTLNGPNCAVPSRCVLTTAGGTSGTCHTTSASNCN